MRKGFTIVELLVVIAIIAILGAIMFPVGANDYYDKATCVSSMRNLAFAVASYSQDYDNVPIAEAGQSLWPYMKQRDDFFCNGRVFSLDTKPIGTSESDTMVLCEPTFPHKSYDETWGRNLHKSSAGYLDGHAGIVSQYDHEGQDLKMVLNSHRLLPVIPPSLPE